MQELKIYGQWTLNQEPNSERRAHGYFTYNPKDGCNLNIGGAFTGVIHGASTEFPVIHGTCNHMDYEMVTLFNSKFYGTTANDKGYSPEFALLGGHFVSEADIRVKKIRIESDAIKYVFVHEAIKIIKADSENHIIYNQPENITINLDEKGVVSLLYNKKLETSCHRYSVHLEQQLDMEVEMKDCIDCSETFKTISTIISYLTFLLQQPPDITKIILSTTKGEVSLLFQVREGMLYTKLPYESSRLYWMIDKQSFEKSINLWFNIESKISPSIKILFDTYLGDFVFSENSFLNICQAIELYHRQYYKVDEKEIHDFYCRIEEILSEITDNRNREFIKDKIGKYAHEKSLRKRLKECVAELEHTQLYSKIGIDKSFFNKVVNSRNYYTHYDPNSKSSALELIELTKLSAKLKIILVAIILKRLGCEDDFLDHLVKVGKFPSRLLAFSSDKNIGKSS